MVRDFELGLAWWLTCRSRRSRTFGDHSAGNLVRGAKSDAKACGFAVHGVKARARRRDIGCSHSGGVSACRHEGTDASDRDSVTFLVPPEVRVDQARFRAWSKAWTYLPCFAWFQPASAFCWSAWLLCFGMPWFAPAAARPAPYESAIWFSFSMMFDRHDRPCTQQR